MSNNNWTIEQIPDLTGKVTIVTGANSGIGYETAKALAAKGATVIMACRNAAKANQAIASVRQEVAEARLELIQLDLADLTSITDFANSFKAKYSRLDILINNAGIMIPPQLNKTADGFESQFGINHLGHFALTAQLMDVIRTTPNAKVVNVSSIAHRLGTGTINFDNLNSENKYKPMPAYAQSKLANLLFTRQLNHFFKDNSIDAVATAAHPGWTATELQKDAGFYKLLNPIFAQKQPMGALPTLYAAIENLEANAFVGPSGWQELRGHPKLVGMTDAAKDDVLAKRLWDVSTELTGISYV